MRAVISPLTLVFLAACTSTPQTEPPRPGPLSPDAGGAAGFQHGSASSKFDAGSGQRRADSFGYIKLVGARGTFAVNAVNGAAGGVLNAPVIAAAETGSPAVVPADQHNQRVLDYFLAAGVPKEQVSGVDALTLLAARGDARSTGKNAQPVIIGYQSALKRGLGGVTVAESAAWARMSANGEVLGEGLYWPAIPAAAIAQATRLQQRINDVSSRDAFYAALPPGLPPGEVVIHHSSAVDREAFTAIATYDVIVRLSDPSNAIRDGVASTVRHFDIEGKEVRLPIDQRRAQAEGTKSRPASR